MTAIISRIFAIFMTLISIILPAQPNNVEVTVKDMTTQSTSIVYTCVNNTGRRMDRPYIKSIEKNVDGEWQKVSISLTITEEFYCVHPGGSCTEGAGFVSFDENFSEAHEHLEAGEYKLTIGYGISSFSQGRQQGEASCLFTVTEAE